MSNSVSFSPKVGFTGLNKEQAVNFTDRLISMTFYATKFKDEDAAKVALKIALQLDEFEKKHPGQVVSEPFAILTTSNAIDVPGMKIPELSKICKKNVLYVLDKLGKLGDFGKTLTEACKNMGLNT